MRQRTRVYSQSGFAPCIKKKEEKKEFRLDSNDPGVVCAGLMYLDGCERNACISCLLHTLCPLSTKEKLSVSWQVSRTCGVTSQGSGNRKAVVNRALGVCSQSVCLTQPRERVYRVGPFCKGVEIKSRVFV